ncbi:MAG: heparinase II/III family protein [Gemmatimonadota bacterium]
MLNHPRASEARRATGCRQAADLLDLPPGRRVADLTPAEAARFRLLIGWDPGGPVVAYPLPEETAARARREAWKAGRLGRRTPGPVLWRDEDLDRLQRNAARDAGTGRWLERFLHLAHQVADRPLDALTALVPDTGPWNVAGSFCPRCLGQKSDRTIHASFWRWSPLEPGRIACPHCGIAYPHPDYPERGRIELPRLGLAYPFYLAPEEEAAPDWRDGRCASRFGGGPTHVSFSGEAARCSLAWVLGQVEPLALAWALTRHAPFARAAAALLERLAAVYARYPLYSYRQEYVDAEPAYAVECVDAVPTPFKRAACWYTYCGRLGEESGLHGLGDNTVGACGHPNGEWGASRMAREKASNGEVFLSLFRACDLVAAALPDAARQRLERDLLLEYYLDVKGLTRRVDNKAGPGAVARVAVGLTYGDEAETEAGLAQFRQVLDSQFHPDGSWKETPIYGAKALFEGMAQIPELLRGRLDLYADPLYRAALETFAAAATPLGTQPALDDSPADFGFPLHLAGLVRLRLGLAIPAGPRHLAGFGLLHPESRADTGGGYVPRLDTAPLPGTPERHPSDGPLGFGAVGHVRRPVGDPSLASMTGEERPPAPPSERPALNRFGAGRGLVCLGFGRGPEAVQLYLDGGDGRRTHRHAAPLSLLLFAFGREVLPDLGYIADHPANAWVRHTAAHNTVVVDESPVEVAGPCALSRLVTEGERRCFDVSAPVRVRGAPGAALRFRRAGVLVPTPGGIALVDLFDVEGGGVCDYLVRANEPDARFPQAGGERPPLYQDLPTPPRDFRRLRLPEDAASAAARPAPAAGPSPSGQPGVGPAPLALSWGAVARAHVLSPCDEAFAFRSPAWRDAAEVFAAPDRSWETLGLRRAGPCARFAVVYEIPDPTAAPVPLQVTPLSGFGAPGQPLEVKLQSASWQVDLSV